MGRGDPRKELRREVDRLHRRTVALPEVEGYIWTFIDGLRDLVVRVERTRGQLAGGIPVGRVQEVPGLVVESAGGPAPAPALSGASGGGSRVRRGVREEVPVLGPVGEGGRVRMKELSAEQRASFVEARDLARRQMRARRGAAKGAVADRGAAVVPEVSAEALAGQVPLKGRTLKGRTARVNFIKGDDGDAPVLLEPDVEEGGDVE